MYTHNIATFLALIVTADCPNSNGFPIEGSINEIKLYVREALVDPLQLASLRLGDDSNLAVLAAFKLVRLQTRPGGPLRRHTDGFFGFVEGRLRLQIPTIWRMHMNRGILGQRGNTGFSWTGARRAWHRQDGWYFTGFDSLEVNGEELTLIDKGRRVTLRRSAFWEFEDSEKSWSPEDGAVVARFSDSLVFVGFNYHYPFSWGGLTTIYAIRQQDGVILWQAAVEYGIPPRGSTGPPPAGYSEITIHGDRVAVFQGHFVAMCFHVFQKEDGKPLYRFATSYFDP